MLRARSSRDRRPLALPLALAGLLLAATPGALPAQGGERELFSGPSVDVSRGPIRVSPDGRRLVHADGTPFFWLGDTAWELFHRLSRDEVEVYLQDRRGKGFNVVQAVVLAELDGLTDPNPDGHTPLVDNDPTRPNEAYFRHVDRVVDRAARLGIYIGMLPTWGDKWNKRWGVGPEIFTPDNARAFGEFLGRRYRDRSVIWILGGDRIPEAENHFAVTRAMAEGIRRGDGGRNLITFHPMGDHSSSQFFHGEPWLDFNMFQSGHGGADRPNYKRTEADYALRPVRPVLDGEPRYEDHPIDWKPELGWFDDFDVRQAAYWSVLAGAAGHTYGNHNIWQMWQPGRKPVSSARTPWRDALHHPGARQMGLMRRLFTSRPFLRLLPDQGVLADSAGSGAGHQRAARADDGSYAIAYTPLGRPLRIRMDAVAGSRARATWFDPRTGVVTEIGTFPTTGSRLFDPPGGEGRGSDWVLVLDREDAGYPHPGASGR